MSTESAIVLFLVLAGVACLITWTVVSIKDLRFDLRLLQDMQTIKPKQYDEIVKDLQEETVVSLQKKVMPDGNHYQWRGNDGCVYSPLFRSTEEANEYIAKHGLRPMEQTDS